MELHLLPKKAHGKVLPAQEHKKLHLELLKVYELKGWSNALITAYREQSLDMSSSMLSPVEFKREWPSLLEIDSSSKYAVVSWGIEWYFLEHSSCLSEEGQQGMGGRSLCRNILWKQWPSFPFSSFTSLLCIMNSCRLSYTFCWVAIFGANIISLAPVLFCLPEWSSIDMIFIKATCPVCVQSLYWAGKADEQNTIGNNTQKCVSFIPSCACF